MHEIQFPDSKVLNVHGKRPVSEVKIITCTVRIFVNPLWDGQDIELMIHMGSVVSILFDALYLDYFGRVSLMEPKLQMVCCLKNFYMAAYLLK